MAALTEAEITQVQDAWPADVEDLPASVRSAYDAWIALNMPAINLAIRALNSDDAVGFQTPRGRGFNKPQKCRALTVRGVPPTAGGGHSDASGPPLHHTRRRGRRRRGDDSSDA